MRDNNLQEDEVNRKSTVEDLYKYMLILFLHEERTVGEVMEYLMSEGMNKEDAAVVIANTKAIIYKINKPKAVRNFFLGILVTLIGLAGIVSFFIKSPEAFTGIFTMGTLAYGIMKLTESITTLKEIARFENRKAMFKLPTLKEFFYNLRTLEKRYRVSNDDEVGK